MAYYDRYEKFRDGNQFKVVPGITIPYSGSDLYITYHKDTMRMDMLSYKYYNDPNFGWLIMMANPHLGSLEFSIPDLSTLRIPYPLQTAIKAYETAINRNIVENENMNYT